MTTREAPARGSSHAFVSIILAGLVLQALSFASGPLAARMLGPQGRGDMATVVAVTLLCAQVGMGGLPAAVSRLVAQHGGSSRTALAGLVRRWNLPMLVGAGAAAALVWFLLADSEHRAALAVVAALLTVSTAWQAMVIAMLLGEGQVTRVNAVRIISTILYVLGVVLIFVLAPTDRPEIIAGLYLLTLTVGMVRGAIGLRRRESAVADPIEPAELRQVSRRSFVSSIGLLDTVGLDQLIVVLVLGTTSVGLYAVAFSVTSLPLLVLAPIGAALLPKIAAATPTERPAVIRAWLLGALGIAVLVVVAVQVVVSPAIRLAFGEEFTPAVTPARWLVVAWSLLAMRRVLTAIVQAQGRPAAASTAELGCAAVLVVAVMTGAHLADIRGAAMGLTLAGLVSCAWLTSLIDWHGSVETPDRTNDPAPQEESRP